MGAVDKYASVRAYNSRHGPLDEVVSAAHSEHHLASSSTPSNVFRK